MKVGVPMVIIFIPVMWWILTRFVWKWDEKVLDLDRSHIEKEINELGRPSRAEVMTMAVFFSTALLWIFRADLKLGLFTIPGWSNLFGQPAFLRDSTVAVAAAVALFVLPVNLKKRQFLLGAGWERKVPWGVLILLAGGFALASGFSQTGLSAWLAGHLTALGAVPILLMVLIIVGSVTLFTEVASNTATITVLLPILAASSVVFGVHPYLLMLPATLAASCAFMLPAATPPNAIVFAPGFLHVRDMIRGGFTIDVLATLLITGLAFTVLPWALGIALGVFPDWAR
jgi:sodium-dependent dicarboxylate transporter 2/3/5